MAKHVNTCKRIYGRYEKKLLIIPEDLLLDDEITLNAVKVYVYIYNYEQGWEINAEDIQEKFDMKKPTLKAAVDLLKRLKYLK